MKLIKKIAAIMFAFMMVISMSTNVKAETTEKGSITIENAIDGKTYSIYQILELESHDKDKDHYSYKPASEQWKAFLNTTEAKKYVSINDAGYVTWNNGVDDTKAAEFAKLALAYAEDSTHNISTTKTPVTANGTTVKFENLNLGYYLVGSSAGALCGLNTTNPDVNIQEKNGVPTVEKEVKKLNGEWGKQNSANIGNTVEFKTTITAQLGAQNYVLHDTMSQGLTLNKESIEVKLGDNIVAKKNYDVLFGDYTSDKCTFEIQFNEDFLKTLQTNDTITVTYTATLNEIAVIDGTGNPNETILDYGNKNSTSKSETKTYTYGIQVFKKDGKDSKALAGAKFNLYADSEADANIVKFSNNGTNVYTYKKDGTITDLVSDANGLINIQGLKEGTYFLKEIEAPKGYNKLTSSIQITVKQTTSGTKEIIVNGDTAKKVEVENNTGSLLPSTGGMGTTLIYLVGAALVLGSGIVLATKKNAKAK